MKKKYTTLILMGIIVLAIIAIGYFNKSEPMTFTYNPQSWTKNTISNDYYAYLEKTKNEENASDVHLDEPIHIPAYDYDPNLTTVTFGNPINSSSDEMTSPALGYVIKKDSSNAYSDAQEEKLLYIPETDAVYWRVKVPHAGYYHLAMQYYPIIGKSSAIERALTINGVVPFEGAKNFVFPRIWTNSDKSVEINDQHQISFKQDKNGNDLKPIQEERPTFKKAYFRDNIGYVTEPYRFFLKPNEEGYVTIGLTSIKECILIDYLEIKEVAEIPTYEEYSVMLQDKKSIPTPSYQYRIEAEAAFAKSSPTLYPITDRSSANTYPYSPSKTKLNAIGGDKWKVLGDWISWEIEVPADGFYNISMRAKQNLVRGLYSNRIVYIDDVILFDELNKTIFAYSSKWQNFTLGNKNENYEFYLTKGKHTITMEVTLGEYSTLIERIQVAIDDLNKLYRDIIKFTTPAPDPNRDYELTDREGLNMIDRMTKAKIELKDIASSIETISGTRSDKTAVIETAVVQLSDFIKRPRSVPARIASMSTNISALGTLLASLREFPLEIDYLIVHTPDVVLPKANEGFFRRIWKSMQSFWYSFFIDYSSIGSSSNVNTNTNIEVWMSLGRDQATVIRNLIDESFTPMTGIGVDLKLTGTDVLLKATLAGIGPNVAINVDSGLPVNYGLRDAVLDLREFDDYNNVIEASSKMTDEEFNALPAHLKKWRFKESALRQFQFNEAAYALPEKQIFLMMFVRDDIMNELGLGDRIPNTWEEVIGLVADLQANQLQFYLPVNEAGATGLNPIFVSLLYQQGGSLYINDNKETGLLEDVALEAFEYWTEFYTLYSFPKYASFLNRFRSGEMPIGIAYYELYNTLSVFAPDLRGKWSFYPIPGTIVKNNDGEIIYGTDNKPLIDRTATAAGTGCVILKQPALKDPKIKEASWEFLKWWTSVDTQVRFGREMEGILGSAARHASANVLALEQLAWPSEDYKQLSLQWKFVREVPNVAGSYITGREVENAYRMVINNLYNAKETLYEYAQNIQNEIDRKRKEFNLPLASDGR